MAESSTIKTITAHKKLKVFSGSINPKLAQGIADAIGIELGHVKLETFANGEIYARYLETVRGCDVFIIQSVAGSVNDALMELLIMTDAAKRASAHSVTAVVSHYGYSRQDRKAASREPITAKLVANLMTTAGIDRLITIDLHQGQIQGFLDTPVNHMTALPLFAEYFSAKNLPLDNLCVVSPDVGRAKAAKQLAEMLGGCDLAIMHKSRSAHNVSEVSAVIGDVKGKCCIVNDDMIDTAGTISNGTRALKEAGAEKIYLCATHGILSDPAIDRLKDCPADEIIICDTIPLEEERFNEKFHVISVAPLLAGAIWNVFNEESVSGIIDLDFAL